MLQSLLEKKDRYCLCLQFDIIVEIAATISSITSVVCNIFINYNLLFFIFLKKAQIKVLSQYRGETKKKIPAKQVS